MVANIFDAITDATSGWLTIGRKGDRDYEYRRANGKEQFG
jgi:hypothetical protein